MGETDGGKSKICVDVIYGSPISIYTNRERTVITVAPTYTLGYFLGYNMIGSFLISLLVPVVTLGTFNTLIWRRLQQIWKNRSVAAMVNSITTSHIFCTFLHIS